MAARPTEETDSPFLYHENPEQKKKWETYDLAECGKWMLFFDNANLDEAWDKAKRLYDSGELTGIHSMKVSHNTINVTSGSVLIFLGIDIVQQSESLEHDQRGGYFLLRTCDSRGCHHGFWKQSLDQDGLPVWQSRVWT